MDPITLTKPQTEMYFGEEKFKLFCGGFGSGKSETLILSAMRDLQESKGGSVAIYAPTYDLLKLNIVPRLEEYVRYVTGGLRINRSDFTFNIPSFGNIIMRSLGNPERIIAYEVYRSHIDELDTLPTHKAEEVWNKIIARNRQKGEGQNRVSAYTTPEGYRFCYNRWVKNTTPEYRLYRAPTYTNPHLPEDYIESLRSTYPSQLVDAYIEGHFVNMTSGAVYSSFDRSTCNTTEVWENENEPLHVGMDFNVQHMAGIIHVMRFGSLHAIDEFIDLADTPSIISAIKDKYPKNPIICYPDATGSHTSSTGASKSDIQQLRNGQFRIKAKNINPPIKDRVTSMNAALEKGRYRVNIKACPEYAECLEQQVYDPRGMPDKTAGLDHPVDAGGYCNYWHFPVNKQNFKQTVMRGLY